MTKLLAITSRLFLLRAVSSLATFQLRLIVGLVALGSSSPSLAQVGIGITTPKAFLNVSHDQTVLFGEDTNKVVSPNKHIWYASQVAFRVGGVYDNSWSRSSASDNTNVGPYSFAAGNSTKASNYYSTAFGVATNASGMASTALGCSTTASGPFSVAMGFYSTASGDYSTAIGGYVTTNKQFGSFILSDYSTSTSLGNDAPNQMMMRFTGGYKLYTNSVASVGLSMSPGGNAWQTISDSTRKENFRNVDGESFLRKIAHLRLGSWNYKGQDVKQYRHYGPMAQDFFAAFGQDELGVIGEDKSINQADFDGVNLIAIQALISENQQLKAKLAAYEVRLNKIEALLQAQTTTHLLTYKP